ncbi:MAG: AraC family transcriptional regulator [Allosphingosinicella sp.]
MNNEGLDRFIELLEVRLEAFAMCEVENGCSLLCDAVDLQVVHYVLRGEGSISWDGGSVDLRPGTVVVIPPLVAKQINGAGPVEKSFAGDEACPLSSGIVRFRACGTGQADLILGCASIDARARGGPRLFAHLREPFAERCPDDTTGALFASILRELSLPGLGTQGLVGTMMKQIMILLLRAHFQRVGAASLPEMAMLHPQLGRALLSILDHPQRAHSLDNLAEAAGMSRSRFVHHFSTAYGRTPMEFVQIVRLHAAARMLRNSALPVKAISASVGYASRSHFSQAFRTEFGFDPTAFRRKERRESPPFTAVVQPGVLPDMEHVSEYHAPKLQPPLL